MRAPRAARPSVRRSSPAPTPRVCNRAASPPATPGRVKPAARWRAGEAVTRQVRCDHGEMPRQQRGDRPPGMGGRGPVPCTNSTAEPEPMTCTCQRRPPARTNRLAHGSASRARPAASTAAGHAAAERIAPRQDVGSGIRQRHVARVHLVGEASGRTGWVAARCPPAGPRARRDAVERPAFPSLPPRPLRSAAARRHG